MKEYYFIVSLLPGLEIGHKPPISFADLKELFAMNLAPEDAEKVKKLLRMIDFENIRAVWNEEPLDPRGNLTREEIEQSLLTESWPDGEAFPLYLQDFLAKYHTSAERLQNFPMLMNQFYVESSEDQTGFLKDYFQFKRELQLVFLGFRAKMQNRNLSKELQYEDPTDPLVAQILAQKDSKVYEPPYEFKELKPIFDEFAGLPLELHKSLYVFEFQSIVDLWGGEIFNIERILNFLSRLILVERWMELDVQAGMQVIDEIEKGVK